MTLYFADGSPTAEFTDSQVQEALFSVFDRLPKKKKVLAIPPDFTRYHSQAGKITCMAYRYFQSAMTDVMPALGTHDPMSDKQLDKMFPSLPKNLIRPHRWREDVVTVGEVPAEFVRQVTEGIYDKPWPAQLNKLVRDGGHDLILSVGQVIPHEVIGMANYNKNIFVGTGGSQGINESHFVGAAYGMERMMGRADNPLRQILNYAEREFCQDLPLLYIQTVIGPREDGQYVMRGLYIGDDPECFQQAAALSVKVNITTLDREPKKIVAYLDPEEFHSTWLGNKAIYRTRLLIADQGELIVLAPAVETFGEDKQIDALIRKYGYRTTPQIMQFIQDNQDLRNNLSAAAHLIHGSSENRFTVTYCPGHLTEDEVTGVGYQYADLNTMLQKYNPDSLQDGWNMVDGEEIYFVRNPALGLWAAKHRFGS
ncbi:MAG: lactate racemase domain-containing protein [Pirellulaceae bacterium]